jgi:hypothetical protein
MTANPFRATSSEMGKGVHTEVSIVARVAPEVAIEMVLDAYKRADGFPDEAAKLLGYHTPRRRDALHKLNNRLGIVRIVRRATGHRPGWDGRGRWNFGEGPNHWRSP